MALQFRSEFFNVLNHTNFGLPNYDITNAAFGTIRSTLSAAADSVRLEVDVLRPLWGRLLICGGLATRRLLT